VYVIAKKFSFSASHTLALGDDHPCSRLHGHNYTVEIELGAPELDSRGMVVDYGELRALKTHLDTLYDHRHLNEVMECEPTAENVAEQIFQFAATIWPGVRSVTVGETPATWARFSIP
jgi:6-pyruvoyltetrahydropterin/6-carboxytetrahydropterin synthase